MKKQFTPGPWSITDSSLDENNEGRINIDTKDNTWVAQVMGAHVGPKDLNEIKANAALVCAAPEMFEALNEIIPFALQWINNNHPAMKKAKAAIKKATSNV